MRDTEWMGRYRSLIETLVRHRNAYSRVMNVKTEQYANVSLSMVEWEVLEYIIEHQEDDSNMAQLSERLMIPASSFSKITKALFQQGLIEKYRIEGNNKTIILKPSEFGIDFYRNRAADLGSTIFAEFFHELDGFSEEELQHIAKALDAITPRIEKPGDPEEKSRKLVKME